jgi:hypothetical protein
MSGELPAMAPPWCWGGAAEAPPVSSGRDASRPFADQRLRLEDTPSRGRFIKEPLDFFIIEPAVLSAIS